MMPQPGGCRQYDAAMAGLGRAHPAAGVTATAANVPAEQAVAIAGSRLGLLPPEPS